MRYPRLASLAVMVMAGFVAYFVAPDFSEPKSIANNALGTLQLLTMFLFGFFAYSGLFGILISFGVEPGDTPGSFRTRDNILGKLLEWGGGDFGPGAGYCEFSMYTGFCAFAGLITFLLFVFIVYAISINPENLVGIGVFLGGVIGVIILFLLTFLSVEWVAKRSRRLAGFLLLLLVGAICTGIYFLMPPMQGVTNWRELAIIVGTLTFFGVGVGALFGLQSLLKKMSFYSRFCPIRDTAR